MKSLKIALVHDWLIHMRGGERVLEALLEVFPQADIFTLFCDRSKLSPGFEKARIRTSFLSFLPGIRRYYRWLLPLFPFAIRTFDLKGYDVILSVNHCVAKGVRVPPGALHICYCNAPMRYVWGFRGEYFGSFPFLLQKVMNRILDRLKRWDLASNATVHFFIGNSGNIRKKIMDFYGRDAVAVYPPVDTRGISSSVAAVPGDYYLTISALVPYKRIDLVIEAFNRLGYPLIVAGDGPEFAKLKKLASGNIRFLGVVEQSDLGRVYAGAKAFVFAADEDFGIVPVEAQACGKPVIAYGKGGALETVTSETGIFFNEQTPEALIEAVKKFESLTFDPAVIRANAERFGREVFKARMTQLVSSVYQAWIEHKPIDKNLIETAQ